MKFNPKIREAVEEGLKKNPACLGKKQLVFFENEKINWSKERTDVEVYLDNGSMVGMYHIRIFGAKRRMSICRNIKASLKKRYGNGYVCYRDTPHEDCILMTIVL